MNKILTGILMLFVMVALIGCGAAKQIQTGPCDVPAAPVVKAAPPAPAPAPKPVLKETIIHFDFDKYALKDMKPGEVNKMKDLNAFLKANPDVEVKLVGHTDWHGTDKYNEALSQRRVETVKNYLVANGVKDTRISIAWKGETQLVDKKVAWPNRRVVVVQIK